MKILVTGANGFIGSSIVNYLAKFSDYNLRILIRKTSNVERLKDVWDKLEIFYGDVRDKESLKEAVKNINLIIHSAAVLRCVNLNTYYEVNHIGTKNLIETVVEFNPNLEGIIYLSSQAAAGPSEDVRYKTVNEPSLPVSHYGKSKLLAEHELMKYKDRFKIVILRPAAVYGPYDKDMYVYFQLAEAGVLPSFSKNFYIQFIYIHDVVKIINLIIENFMYLKTSVYFIAENRCYDIKQIRQIFEQVVNKNIIILHIPYSVGYVAAYINEKIYKVLYNKPAVFNRDKLKELSNCFWLCDSSSVLSIFPGFTYTPLDVGIRETYKWYKENGWL